MSVIVFILLVLLIFLPVILWIIPLLCVSLSAIASVFA